ncbi:MAG TPA: hypothetical protein VL354_06710, partial [Spirochaetia bacterium]|nr:hypothetical protein [Spirochaetia bacterium]
MWTTKLRTLPLAACILLLPVVSGLCGGQPEAALSDVQQLIAQRDYPNALKLLARIQRNHPEERDETQRLIMEIISSQGREYNEVLAQLVHALYEEQDSDKALPLVGVLQKLDPKRSAAETHRWLTYVKFLKLMDSATLLLKQGKVPEAIDLYLQPITEPGKAQFD